MRYWKRLNSDGNTRTVESYSHNIKIKGAVEINKGEFNAYISSLPSFIPKLSRDAFAEIDEIKAEIVKLKKSA